MTKIPIDAGNACLMSNFPMDSELKLFEVDGFIRVNYREVHSLIHFAKRETQAGSSFKQGIVIKFLPPTS